MNASRAGWRRGGRAAEGCWRLREFQILFPMKTPYSFIRYVPVLGQLGLAIGVGFLMFALL